MSRPAAPESETPETDAMPVEWTVRRNGVPTEYVSKERARSLERRLSLAQTEIKGHMRVKDDLEAEVIMLNGIIRVRGEALAKAQARIAELKKALASVPAATANPSATWDKLNQWHLDHAALKSHA